MSSQNTNKKSQVKFKEGGGIATRNPNHLIRLKIRSGLFLLIYDPEGKSGGLIHLLEKGAENSLRIRRLIEAVGAASPVAKLVGQASVTFFDQINLSLTELNVSLIAHSVEQEGTVELRSAPALGMLKYKWEPSSIKVTSKKVRVMIVDDSPVMRRLLTEIISKDKELEIVGQAGSAAEADELLKTVIPDVMTLDIHMPVEDGVSFLRRLMLGRFIPVVLVTSVSMSEGEEVFEALSLGAIDYVQKPALDELEEVRDLICEKLKVAAKVREKTKTTSKPLKETLTKLKSRSNLKQSIDSRTPFRLVAIGASTGGVQALTEILTHLPEEIPPIVIVQHIPPVFSRAFCERLDRICPFRIKEAEDGDLVLPGQVLLAPGGFHMKVQQNKGKLVVRVFDADRVNRHKPSVEVLFKSVAEVVGSSALGIILTGMGDDGAEGLLLMKNKGAITIAQDEASSVVFGMPGVAIKIGAAQQILSLAEITKDLIKLSLRKKTDGKNSNGRKEA